MSLRIFLTGGTGYVGRPLVERLLRDDDIGHVNCLIRNESQRRLLPASSRLRFTIGDLTRPDSYVPALNDCDVVLHLAAVTGAAPQAEYWRVNFTGTADLVDASVAAGVSHFVFVSTIAATFADQWRYHYAQSKAAAETKVLDSPLRATVIRPTIVTGQEAAVTRGLQKLRQGRFLLLFGSGAVQVQPIALQDLVERLHATVIRPPEKSVIEAGGNDVLSLRRFIEFITTDGDTRLWTIRIPVRPLRMLLAAVDPWACRWLPLTAGQLALFLNDSTIAPSDGPATDDLMKLDDLVAECRT